MTPEADSDLVRRCLDGDRTAWADLLGRFSDLIYGLLRRSGLTEAAAADAFQEVSLLLWKHLRRLRATERLLPFIATTTRRVAWRMKKRDRARESRDRDVSRPEAAPEPSPADQVAALEQEQAVRVALSGLGERCRRLLSALYFTSGDDGYDAIAERLGMPRGSIGPTRQRCLEGLRAALLALGFPGDPAAAHRAPTVSPKARAASLPAGRTPRPRRGTSP